MTLKKEIIVLGDIEMGAGNLTDDFISDKALSELITELSKRRHSVDLILNGDTFDFLKCPFFADNKLIYPRHITNKISQKKLRSIYHAHKKVFRSLTQFIKKKNHHIYFIIGNHDFDLAYRGVQKYLRKILQGTEENIFFAWQYNQHQVYVEHGHQYDIFNNLPFNRLFLSYKGKSILNLPWITFGLISQFMFVKEKHPFSERVTNRSSLFSNHHALLRKMTFKSLAYFIKNIIYYPFRYYSDPTYSFPKELIRELTRRIKKLNWDLDTIIPIFKNKKRKVLQKAKIHVLGHIHEKYLEDKEGRVIIHPGSWRDEYNLHKKTKRLIPRPKRYVQIMATSLGLDYQLIKFPIARTIFNFDQVIANEKKFLQLAAKEEGYEPVFY